MKIFLLTSLWVAAMAASTAGNPHELGPVPHLKIGNVTTQDGVELQYIQAGPPSGQQLLFIPGWRQTAAQWNKQIEYFSSAGYRVTTYDMRGHGDSAKPGFGYRLSRFGADLNDVINSLSLCGVSVVAHSMGSSVTWAFWDHVGAGSYLDVGAKEYLVSSLILACASSMFTSSISQSDLDWMIKQNRKMSDAHAATLLINHAFMDWRDVLPRIDIPALVLAGDASLNNATGITWAASQIPGAQKYIFTKGEKGSHFAFWENPELFNQVVERFVTS
ncbi:related to non-heme chloroperoxidase [Fusarium fujikuroi]|uniref:Related to non-heme chloroperoxidase n=1 Tax=Gibberella fujikuroi (strain CBS 195.34 / IMI 58289 / NRRL A-6831) TaxID=1279085 RepID=S0ENC3_GIBF5|nr:related to non-heme chloroperoxidase [Fusarium fujikuroi IMI 58289]SCO10591.1 related to non-heme chloroperoxidase [Fusarium fujikuroi]CCT76212.1 related to non-heme chloroperoxidase [Fusarium fujikuroi IMI 58289]SCO23889.1 related to non-heme chloroperoxidase [Fusarium fujikuroi]SCO25800.1 related to non-heme chloroperoxidase [Fusarium fujikuroi]SCO26762.1 related to non-heme chloroperoxidase [Fusarium fujikuroi]